MIRGFQNSAAISITYKGMPLWVIIAGRKPGGLRKLDHEQHLIYCETVPGDCCISCFTFFNSVSCGALPASLPGDGRVSIKVKFQFCPASHCRI